MATRRSDSDMIELGSTENTGLLQSQPTPKSPPRSRFNFLSIALGIATGMALMYLAMRVPDSHHTCIATRTDVRGGDDVPIDDATSPSTTDSAGYSRVQGLGFQIYTGGAPAFLEDDSINPECAHLMSYGRSEGKIQCYIGQKDSMKDVQQRVDIMISAVERAYELSDKSEDTLKIFLAPEFFWRGVDGAYVFSDSEKDDGDCTEICQILQAMESLVAQKRFKDWFFVFGTIIASETLPEEDAFDYLFYNFAPVYRGYDPAKTDHIGKRFLVPKRYVSNIDFLTPRRHFDESLSNELLDQYAPPSNTTVLNPHDFDHKRYDNEMWIKYKGELSDLGYTMIEYDWLVMDGITLTIEICLDHDMHTAINAYMANMATGSRTLIPSGGGSDGISYVTMPKHQAQISLISSAGMGVNTESLVLTQEGTVFLQDGLSGEPSHMVWGQDPCQPGLLDFEGGSQAVRRHAVLTPTEVLFEYRLNTARVLHDLFVGKDWKSVLGGVFSTSVYSPSISVYDPIDIAQVNQT